MHSWLMLNNKIVIQYMKKILIVSRDISQKLDGGTLVSKRNERLLQSIGFETSRFIVPIPSLSTRMCNILFKQSYGSTKSLFKSFRDKLKEQFDYIFFDGSIYGGYLKYASKIGCKTICFYHNVESEYYRQKAKQTGSLADKLMVPYIRYNERLSTIYSDGRITLNDRDSKLLTSLYDKGGDVVIPTSLPRRDIKSMYYSRADENDSIKYLLFVGSNFFANYEGLNRFICEIAPKISWKVKVVGNIDKAFQNIKDVPKNIEFVGRVDNLDQYYINASAVIAPIFSGSGLKTKTVEAISYGKTVIGFPEAFEGIDFKNYPGACISVLSDSDFISRIKEISPDHLYNEMSAKLFQEKLSDEAQQESLSTFFKLLENGKKI